jgi:hypothetical protein
LGSVFVPWENSAMPGSWALTPPYCLCFGLLCGVVGFRIGWRTRNRLALPLVQASLGWGAFLLTFRILGPAWAAAAVAAWILGTTAASIYVFVGHPRETDERVLRAEAYRAPMLAWLECGVGPEARPVATAIAHLREAVWYTAAAMATANFASIGMGAVLLNEMNAYVATLVRAARRHVVLVFAWHVWSVVRVAAYTVIGAAAAIPLLRRYGWDADAATARALAASGVVGIIADLVLKLVLSRSYGRTLASAVDLAAAKANRSAEVPLALHLDG